MQYHLTTFISVKQSDHNEECYLGTETEIRRLGPPQPHLYTKAIMIMPGCKKPQACCVYGSVFVCMSWESILRNDLVASKGGDVTLIEYIFHTQKTSCLAPPVKGISRENLDFLAREAQPIGEDNAELDGTSVLTSYEVAL